MMNLYTDTHCHLDFDRFDQDRQAVIERAWEAGLVWILNPGIDLVTNQQAISLANKFPGKINAAVGIHPNHGLDWSQDIFKKLGEQARQPVVVAIGEIGLDYYREHTSQQLQRKMFQEQLTLAEERGLPVVIHNRQSIQDLLAILTSWHKGLQHSNNPLAKNPGVLHSYDADLESAVIAMQMNFFIGISGPVTFTNAPDRKAITRELPLDHILLETDAPFLAPHPHRGKRNEPAYIPLIAQEIAHLHNTSPETVAETTYANAVKLFKLNRK